MLEKNTGTNVLGSHKARKHCDFPGELCPLRCVKTL